MKENELAEYFVVQLLQASGNIQGRIDYAIESIRKMIQEGWSIADIKNELDAFARSYPQILKHVYHLAEVFVGKQPPNNLMDPELFYYHNALRFTSPPVRITFKDGQCIREEHPFFLEMKPAFTMQNLLEYWYQSNLIRPSEHIKKQDESRFKYLLNQYTIDEVLFMIDIAQADRKEKRKIPLRNVFELQEKIDEAQEAIKAKQNVHKQEKINYEIKRVNPHG